MTYVSHYTDRADDKVIKDTRIQLIDLDPFSNYTISIGAYTSAGAGPKSRPIPVQTKESGMCLLFSKTISLQWVEITKNK